MCGIAGIVSREKQSLAPILKKVADTIRHRGPDDEGFLFGDENNLELAFGADTPAAVKSADLPFAPKLSIGSVTNDANIGLAFRRLAIIDPSAAGHQPMCSSDGRFWMVFNGEIYNYIELKEQLVAKGHQFYSDTDSEVIIKAYQQWGKECVQQFNGMWAFVIYDREEQLLFGSRDRTGVKPFYYYLNDAYFAFASEHKALLEFPFVERKINSAAAFDFLVLNRSESEKQGLFEGILELQPAHNFTFHIKNHHFKSWKYFNPEVNTAYENLDEQRIKEYSETLKELLTNAVKIRLRSDVPVGSCLSGGLDSSSIVCLVKELEPLQQKVFTASLHNKQLDESPWAKIVADATGSEWLQTYPEKEGLQKDLEELVYCQDIPIRSTSTYAQYQVMKMIAGTDVKVVLDGQGGDELLGGYHIHKAAIALEQLKRMQFTPAFANLNVLEGAKENLSFLFKNALKFNYLHHLPIPLHWKVYQSFYSELKYLNKEWLNEHIDRLSILEGENIAGLNKRLEFEYFNGFLKELLKCEDRCSMHFSLESRTPFADDLHLMKFAFEVPGNYKIVNGNSKFLLREAMKNVLPEPVRIRQDKKGFVTPNNQWIRELRASFKPYIEADRSGIFNKELLLKDYDTFFDPQSDVENYRLFKFICFAVWMKVFELS